ncbi:MAG: acyltransferase [Clostridiales bacterium]
MTNTVTDKSNRIYVLDYIKAIAMISVIINHCTLGSHMEKLLLYPYFIGLAVPFFILISGFTFSLSYHKMETMGIGSWYKKSTVLPKLSRFLAPFIVIFPLEVIYRWGIVGIPFDLYNVVRSFFFGGYGPGSYYVPLLVEMLFVFPLCYVLIKKYGFKGVLILVGVQLIFQVGVYYIDLDTIYYKRIILRYLVFLAGGIYIYLHQKDILKSKRNIIFLLFSLLIGGIYIYAVNYQGYVPDIFAVWRRTAMPTILYVFPIMAFFISYFFHKKIPGKFGDLLSLVGQSSYHIFLIQMFWFHIGWEKTLPYYLAIPLNLALTITLGILFYKAENNIRKKLKQRKDTQQKAKIPSHC